MNHLIAKLNGKEGGFFKVISNNQIFELPENLDNPIEYTTDYKLEDDEWFCIKDFSQKDYCPDFLKQTFISTDYNQISVEDYTRIDYLCAYQTGLYYFQKLSSSQVIRKKYFSFSQAPVLIVGEPIIVIDNFPDAIYQKNIDILFFRKLPSITSIFKGIDILFREATHQETKEFLENTFIHLENDYSVDKVKMANRKRIAIAMETLQRFTVPEKQEMFNYIREYCIDLNFEVANENFTISSEDELKKLLYGIEQRYYTTKLGAERRLANSIIKL